MPEEIVINQTKWMIIKNINQTSALYMNWVGGSTILYKKNIEKAKKILSTKTK